MVDGQEHTSAASKGKTRNCAVSAGVGGAHVKAIETVKAGDRVLSRNAQTGRVELKRVLRTTVKQARVVVRVTLASAKSGQVVETLTSSREHPYFVRGKGFVPAGGRAIGNAIVTRAGPDLIVKGIDWQRRVAGYKVYNFVVEDDHSYFVGTANGGAWVHNPRNYQASLFAPDPPPMDLNAAAKDLHNLLPGRAQRATTTGMGTALDADGTLLTIVSSSDNTVPPIIRSNLQPGWLVADGPGHAETTFLDYCAANNLTPLTVAASRPICMPCAYEIFRAGAVPVSPIRLW